MASTKDLFDMTDDELMRLADENSAAWHTAGEGDKAGLHAENVRINSILDSRRGETTTFDPDSGLWSPREETLQDTAVPKAEGGTPGDWIGGSKVSGSGAVGSWGGGQFSYSNAPTYTSKYQGKIDELTAQILGRAAFEYDPEKDPTFQQYKERYTRDGERAMQDTLGQVSARTGGLASSYAGAAAQQTYDGYMSALSDKIPELRQLAYQMYQDEGATQRANLEMLQALEQGDYSKYLTLLGQYNNDRSFDYGIFRDQVGDSQWQQTFDRGVLESDRDFAYQLGRDQIGDQRYNQEYADSRADVEWQRLNYASETEHNRALQKAQTLAAAGDFSGYQEMGYSESEVANLKTAYDKAQAAVASSKKKSGSGGSSSGETGILAAMYAMGNDAVAYEYLVGLDLSATKTDTLWGLYQSGGQTQSKNYTTVRAQAAGYKNPQDAKAYLERMVDGGYITPDEAADIYQVDLGGIAQAQVSSVNPEFRGIYDEAFAAMQTPGGLFDFIKRNK